MTLEFKNVSKSIDGKKILEEITFAIEAGETLAIIGPSGAGKTTCLKLINRLTELDNGEIQIDGSNIKNIDKIKLRRKIGYVFQSPALFPHMTISRNISLLPQLLKWDTGKIKERVKSLLELVNLSGENLENRYPAQLSGGQQQRVAVARALAADPEILLMDEPFSALDPINRRELQDEFLRIKTRVKQTIIMVSHDIKEAFKLADKILFIHQGKILGFDTAENIFNKPGNPFIESFIREND